MAKKSKTLRQRRKERMQRRKAKQEARHKLYPPHFSVTDKVLAFLTINGPSYPYKMLGLIPHRPGYNRGRDLKNYLKRLSSTGVVYYESLYRDRTKRTRWMISENYQQEVKRVLKNAGVPAP